MDSRKKLLLFFILPSFIFYSSPACSAGEEGKAKVEAKLIALKNLVIQERLRMQKLNDELKGENIRLLRDNEQLQQTISELRIQKDYLTDHPKRSSKQPKSRSEEKIVYRDSPSQQEEIQKLQQRISGLNQSLEEKDQEIAKGKADIQYLNKVIEEVYDKLLIISGNKY